MTAAVSQEDFPVKFKTSYSLSCYFNFGPESYFAIVKIAKKHSFATWKLYNFHLIG